MTLKNQTAIVTGSTTGLGKKISELLLKEGANVVISSRREDNVARVVDEFKNQFGDAVTGIAADVKDLASVQKLTNHALETFGSIEILVANAGTAGLYGPFNHISTETLAQLNDTIIGTNLIGTINCVHAVLPTMIANKYGRIITVSGGGGDQQRPLVHQLVYSASKGGVVSFSMCLAREIKEERKIEDIKVNVYSPGIIETDMVTGSQVVPNWITVEELQQQMSLVFEYIGTDIHESCEKVIPYASPSCKKTGTVIRGFSLKKMIFGGMKLQKAMKALKAFFSFTIHEQPLWKNTTLVPMARN